MILSASQTPPEGPDERSDALLDLSPWGVNLTLTLHRSASPGPTDEPDGPRRRRRKRPSRVIEPPEYAAMMRRMLAAHGRRVADADVEDLADLMALRHDLDEAVAYAVRESRSRWGRAWVDIARAATIAAARAGLPGMTRQAAQQKWGQR